jgi:hypothetical protein
VPKLIERVKTTALAIETVSVVPIETIVDPTTELELKKVAERVPE